MKLGDILRKLFYREEIKETKRKVSRDYYDPKSEQESRFAKISGDIYQEQKEGALSEEIKEQKKKKILLRGLIIFGVIIFLGLSFLIYLRVVSRTYNDEKVSVQIIGQEKIETPARVQYQVEIKNDNLVDLEEAVVMLEGPFAGKFIAGEGIEVQNERVAKKYLGTIKKKSKKTFPVEMEFLTSKQDQSYINVQLEYQPKNFSSRFSTGFSKDIILIPSTLTLRLVPTRQAASGEKIELEAFIKNDGPATRNNIILELDYPENFSFIGSEPQAVTGENRWLIKEIEPGTEKKVKVEGTLEGLYETVKSFQGVLKEEGRGGEEQLLFETSAVVQMVTDRISLRQEISQSDVYAGGNLTYDIYFRNSSPVPLRDLILTQDICSSVLNKETVRSSDGGFYNSRDNTITWKASDVPALKVLEPNQQGKVSFNISLIEDLPTANEDDKNFKIVSQAEIHSLDVDSPIGLNKKIFSAQREVLVNSRLALQMDLVHKDEMIATEGPIPPQVDQETTFVVRFQVLNTSNDLQNVTLKTSLPSGVSWKDWKEPSNSGVQFNERTNELTWLIGTVDAHTGFSKPGIPLSFKIGVTPSQNQVGEYLPLLNGISISADDNFTKQKIKYDFKGANANALIDVRDAKVVPASQPAPKPQDASAQNDTQQAETSK